MSIVKRQLNSFVESAIQNILRNGKAIPTVGRIFDTVDHHIQKYGIILGEPTYKGFEQQQYQRSNPYSYNLNIDSLKFDFDIFFEESIDQSLSLLRNFNASYVLNRRLLSEISGLIFDIESARELRNGYRFIVSDSFSNGDLVDQVRSTTTLDLSTGKIRLPIGTPKTADLSFLEGVSEPFSLKFDRGLISKAMSPGSSFGNLANGTSSYWQIIAHTNDNGPLSMSFQLPVTRDGSRIKVNGIYIDPVISNSCVVTVEYREGLKWSICYRETVESANSLIFPSIITDTLRITMTKDSSDSRLGNRYVYGYGLKAISVFLTSTQQDGEFYSKSLKLAPGLEQDATAVSLDLLVDQYTPAGTSIEYFVAIDEYISGTFYPSGQYTIAGISPYNHGSNGLYFSSDVSGNYVLRSSVRDFPFADSHSTWIPDWKKIEPNTSDGRLVGKPLLLDFANKIDKDHSHSGFPTSIESVGKFSNVDLLKIYEFKDEFNTNSRPIPTNITLRQGRGCYQFEEKLIQYNQSFVGTGTIIDGRLKLVGNYLGAVVPGSVKDLRPWGENVDSTFSFVEREDYVVNYGSPDVHSAEIVATGGKMTVLGSDRLDVRFTYSLRTVDPIYTLSTSFEYSRNDFIQSREQGINNPTIKITWWDTNLGNIESVKILNYNDSGVLMGSRVETAKTNETIVEMDIRDIGQGYGFFEMIVSLNMESGVFDYTVLGSSFSISVPGLLTNNPPSLQIYSDPLDHPDGILAWVRERQIRRNLIAAAKAQNETALISLTQELNIPNRFVIPGFITIYSHKDSMSRVSEDYMKYRVHKYDHTKFCVIRQNDGYYSILVNDPALFQRNSALIKDGVLLDRTTGIVGLDASELYDIDFIYSSGRFDSVLLKAILKGSGISTPEIRSYNLKVVG